MDINEAKKTIQKLGNDGAAVEFTNNLAAQVDADGELWAGTCWADENRTIEFAEWLVDCH